MVLSNVLIVHKYSKEFSTRGEKYEIKFGAHKREEIVIRGGWLSKILLCVLGLKDIKTEHKMIRLLPQFMVFSIIIKEL